MSYKTDRLAALFPDAYAARERGGTLNRLLETLGHELMSADVAVKGLLKSHWVDHATGPALDGLGSIFGLERRTLGDGTPELDDAYRQRLRSVVLLFTGGGTRLAVLGAVRSALGLPFDLATLQLPPRFEGLRKALEELITLDEFSPKVEAIREDRVELVEDAAQVVLTVDLPAVKQGKPRLQWTLTKGAGRVLSVQLRGSNAGFRSRGTMAFPEGTVLVFTSDTADRLNVIAGSRDVSSEFTALDGASPARLPEMPLGHGEWVLRAQGGFDRAAFDQDTFDIPAMTVELQWVLYQPLTFDVHVPHAVRDAVTQLARRFGYEGELFVYQGLPLASLPDVVDQTRAAGVRGTVHFSVQSFEDQRLAEGALLKLGTEATREDVRPADRLSVGSVNDSDEDQRLADALGVGGVFDVSLFDGSWVFQ